jgi:hypothetical protein
VLLQLKAKDLANAEAENLLALCLLFLFHTGLILIPLINPLPKVDISALKKEVVESRALASHDKAFDLIGKKFKG